MTFDLDNYSALASSDGIWMPLLDPGTDEPLVNDEQKPVRIKVVGVDSPAFREKEREFLNKRLQKGIKGKIGTIEQIEAERIDTLVACTVSWEGFVRSGQPWNFSPVAAKELYSNEQWRWIADQVNAFIGDRKNFLPTTKTN